MYPNPLSQVWAMWPIAVIVATFAQQLLAARYSVLIPASIPLRYSVLTPSGIPPQVLRAHPLKYFSSCTSYRQVHHAHLLRYSVLIPMLGSITYAQVAKLRIPMFTSLLHAYPAQVPCAHSCSGTLCSPLLRYPMLTPAQLLHAHLLLSNPVLTPAQVPYAHPSSGTLCSPMLRYPMLTPACSGTPCSPCSGTLCSPCSGTLCLPLLRSYLY